MNFYTFFTQSHKSMYEDYFLNSFPYDQFNLIAEEFKQECPTASFRSEGWNKTMRQKIATILKGLKDNKGDLIVHGDCDIQFFPSNGNIKNELIKELGSHEMAFQDDGYALCAGFFICKCTDRVISLFEEVNERLEEFSEDQDAMNKILPSTKISYKKLSSKFYTLARDNQWQVYGGQMQYEMNNDRANTVLVHHANFTIGIDNKLKLLELVKKSVLGL